MDAELKRKQQLNALHSDAIAFAAKAPTAEGRTLAIMLVRLIEIERDGQAATAMPSRHHP